MKKISFSLLVSLALMLPMNQLFGQASAYTMTPSLVTYTPITGGTVLSNIAANSGISTVTLGFNFDFEGVTYTSCRVTSDGYLSFNVSGATFSANFNDLDGTNQRPLVAPLWDDLDGNAPGSEFRHETIGVTPNREHVFQWNEFEWNWQASDEVISFQIRLHENGDLIDFVYRQDANTPQTPSASIGLAGAAPLNFLSLQGTTTAPATSNTIEATFLTTRPATGQQYRFTPPTCPAPSALAQTGSTSSTIDLSWTSGGASDWNVEYGIVGFVPGTGTHLSTSGTSTMTISGLSASACFDVYVRDSCAPGDVSIWIGPVQMCTAFNAPLLENFDSNTPTTLFSPTSTSGSFDNGWSWESNSAFGIFGWLGRNNRTSSSPGGPWVDHTSGQGIYLYCENSSGGVGDSAHLYSPFIDISAVGNPTVRMWYHKWSTSATAIPDIVLYADTGNGFDVLLDDTTMIDGTHTGNANTDPWDELLVQLPTTSATSVRFRITQVKEFCCADAAIDDFEVFDLLDDDAKAVSLDDPIDGSCAGDQEISITIQNNGADTITTVDVGFQVNGGAATTETINLQILPFDQLQYTFTGLGNLPAGIVQVAVWTALTGDGFSGNDTIIDSVTIAPVLDTVLYCEGFENGDGGWTTGGSNNTWDIGIPSGSIINSPANGMNAAVTNLSGLYNNNEESFLLSPCFDFSAYDTDPILEFSHTYQTETNWDETWVEYSTDGGISWDKLGRSGQGINWYNNGSNDYWEGDSPNGAGVWNKARITMDDVKGEANVKIRFRLSTDGSVMREGVGVDDVTIVVPPDENFLGDLVSTCNDPNFLLDAGIFQDATYLWSTGDTTQTINVTTAGVYTVTVTEPKIGLSFTDSVEVIAMPPPTVAFERMIDTIRFSQNAQINLFPALPLNYTYSWSDGTNFHFFVARGSVLGVGTHIITVDVEDTVGCTGTGIHTIEVVEDYIGINSLGASSVSIYPNPANQFVTLELNGKSALGQLNLSLIDNQGRTILQQRFVDETGYMKQNINLDGIAKGVYVMQLQSNSGLLTQKILIQ